MGNFVYQVMAQNVDRPKQVFQNTFMVAADVRANLFKDDFNPLEAKESTYAEGDTGIAGVVDADIDLAQVDLEFPADEEKKMQVMRSQI
jgi:hypothetical protein